MRSLGRAGGARTKKSGAPWAPGVPGGAAHGPWGPGGALGNPGGPGGVGQAVVANNDNLTSVAVRATTE